jgi:hypothetical protein
LHILATGSFIIPYSYKEVTVCFILSVWYARKSNGNTAIRKIRPLKLYVGIRKRGGMVYSVASLKCENANFERGVPHVPIFYESPGSIGYASYV